MTIRSQSSVVATFLLAIGGLPASSALAQSGAAAPMSRLEPVQVTATRFGEPPQEVPGSISVVSGDEMRARGATDLRTALALLAGVSVAPGGDAGPASAVPGLLGVREIDDLLLLIDGIPAGGAFVPQVEAISLINVERIEVLRGAAPVYFGTTAFAGTINVIHYPAGKADSAIGLRVGSFGSVGVSGAAVLSTGAVRQSVSAELSDDGSSDRRAGYNRAQGSWRLATDVGGGSLHADVNLLALRQKPTSPTPLDKASGKLTALLPKDFNQNPADARLDTDRYQLVLGYELPLSFGRWGSTVAYTETLTDSVRGFIDADDTPQPWTPKTSADLEAFKQSQRLRDLFIDSHLTTRPLPGLDLTTGVNLLLGRANAESVRYGHRLLLDGVSSVPDIDAVSSKGNVHLGDSRRFFGLYAQSRYQLGSTASLLAGLRWNSTHESRDDSRSNSRGVVTGSSANQDVNRLSGSLGAQWKAWQASQGAVNGVTLHASVGNTFQPAQLDFSPNPEAQPEGGGLLKPETQRSLVTGFKVDAFNGLAEFDVDAFFVDFNNQPVQGTANGTAVLRSVGKQRYRGVDLEGVLRPLANWTVKGTLTLSDARYRDYVTEIDGVSTQLAGKRQVLTPRVRAAAGVVYSPERGWRGSLTANWTGKHWLNSINTAEAPSYAVVDASLGYRFDKVTLQVSATNLGNRRDAAQLSELGEGQFYRLPARRVDASMRLEFQ